MPVYLPSSGGAGSGLNANPASPYGAQPYVYNYSPNCLPKWRAALGNAKTGVANAKLLFAGDSTTFGNHSNGSGSGDYTALSVSQQVANALKAYGQNNATGINASADCFFGSGTIVGNGNTRGSNDGRCSFGTGWTVGGSYGVLGGTPLVNTSTTNVFAFTPR